MPSLRLPFGDNKYFYVGDIPVKVLFRIYKLAPEWCEMIFSFLQIMAVLFAS